MARRKSEQKAAFLCAGIVASTIINANPYRKPGARRSKAEDFLPRERTPTQIVTPEQAWARFKGWAEDLKNRQERGKRGTR